MNIPTNLFMWIIAAVPIAVLMILMLKMQWGATKAAPLCLIITVITAMLFYKADIKLVLSESGKGVWNALIIMLIVWTAILLYQVGSEANAFAVIRDGMRRLIPNELVLILSMGWIFGSFLQGITGFGVPVAVGAPLLIGIGVSPMWAVLISLIGQAWGNTFGTLAAAWDSLAMTVGLEEGSEAYFSAAFWTGLFIWIWNLFGGLIICWFYGKWHAVKKGLPAVVIFSIIQGGGELLFTQFNTTISCFIPSCISMIAALLISRTRLYGSQFKIEESPIMENVSEEKTDKRPLPDMTLGQAFIPYFCLSGLTLIVLLIGPVKQFLGKISFGFSFPETSTGYGYVNPAIECFSPITPFQHASMFLLVSALVGLIYYKKKVWIERGQEKAVFSRAFSMTLPSGIAVICLTVMSKIMDGTGQTTVLANGITEVLGEVFVILVPFVGLLGTFMTGSNMSSNILFGGFQMETARLLDVYQPAVLGAQSAGGAIGSIVSPSKIILGTTTANILGSEGKLLRKALAITMPITLLIGFILYIAICI